MRVPSLLVLVSFLSLAVAQRDRGRDDAVPAPSLKQFTYEEGTFASTKVRRGEAGYGVYLPKAYGEEANAGTKYPWILWLHGFGGASEFTRGGGADLLDTLAADGTLTPVVMVVFRAPQGRTTYMNGESSADMEDLIVQDLVPHLEQKYRLRGERGQRALMGVSMGGMGALKIAMHHPDVFGTVAVHSAAILPDDPALLSEQYARMVQRHLDRGGLDKVFGNPIEKDRWAAQMPLGLAAMKTPEDLKGLHVYFDAGTEDRYEFCEPNERLSKVLAEKKHTHLFRKIAGGGHAWSSPKMRENLTVSLQFVAAAFAGKDPIAAATAVAHAMDPAAKPTEPKARDTKEAAGK